MPNLVDLSLMVSDKKIFKDFKKIQVLLPWQSEFLSQILSKNSEKGSWQEHFLKVHQNRISSCREEDV